VYNKSSEHESLFSHARVHGHIDVAMMSVFSIHDELVQVVRPATVAAEGNSLMSRESRSLVLCLNPFGSDASKLYEQYTRAARKQWEEGAKLVRFSLAISP
jgi:hypothetical protein